MPGYNAYAGTNNQNNFGAQNNYNGYYDMMQSNYQVQQQYGMDGLPYVHGIEGAYAQPLPRGVNKMVLWDDTEDCFYVKGYDEMGKPKVLAWNDFHPHKEQEKKEPANQPIDMSKFSTKEDLKELLSLIDMSNFVTKDYLEGVIKQLCVGERGRIVITDEHDA